MRLGRFLTVALYLLPIIPGQPCTSVSVQKMCASRFGENAVCSRLPWEFGFGSIG